MSFTYSCFISHRDYNSSQDLLGTFLDQLEEALENEMKLYDMPVYRYTTKRQAGKYHRQIAEALCQSLCMILVFTPEYFSQTKPYCTREYIGMKRLLKERAKKLESSHDDLIIPIILRGSAYLPSELTNFVNCFYDFEKFTLAECEICRHPEFSVKIQEIAKVVGQFCRETRTKEKSKLTSILTKNCANFELPKGDDKAVIKLIEEANQTPSEFPSL